MNCVRKVGTDELMRQFLMNQSNEYPSQQFISQNSFGQPITQLPREEVVQKNNIKFVPILQGLQSPNGLIHQTEAQAFSQRSIPSQSQIVEERRVVQNQRIVPNQSLIFNSQNNSQVRSGFPSGQAIAHRQELNRVVSPPISPVGVLRQQGGRFPSFQG